MLVFQIIFHWGIQEIAENTGKCCNIAFLKHWLHVVTFTEGFFRAELQVIHLLILLKFHVVETALQETRFILCLHEFCSAGYTLGWEGTHSVCCSADTFMLHDDVAALMICV